MQKLGRNENYMATFDAVKGVLMTDPRFELYIEQNLDNQISDEERQRTLIFENPHFLPFAYTETGFVNKKDEERKRFSFECNFRDLTKGSMGRIKALLIFNELNEAYFETLTVHIELPKNETIRVVEGEIERAEYKED